MQLLDALEWCLEIGITCVSAYAFSIDNFKRPSDEVDMLMRLAEEKLEELLHVSEPHSAVQTSDMILVSMSLLSGISDCCGYPHNTETRLDHVNRRGIWWSGMGCKSVC